MRQRLATFIGIAALLSSMLVVTNVALAANPAATLDQCANGGVSSPDPTACQSANEWVNGNLGASKAHYAEGESVPYRLRFSNLATAGPGAVHKVIIEWDTTKGGKHALDYLTTWNRTVSTANPCIGVSGCVLGSPTNPPLSIPVDPQVSGEGVTQLAGVFTMWGGTLGSVTATANNGYTYADGTGFAGDKSARIEISFTASVANPVLAWGGHIATRLDWGNDNSAVAISGSPFHMRLIDLDGAGGNQDRSLSNDAVIFPGQITVKKHVDSPSSTAFTFTGADFSPNPFTLVDDSANTDPSKLSNDIMVFGAHTVSETNPLPGYKLDSIVCTSSMINNYTPSIAAGGAGGSVSITVEEGEVITCTFNNLAQLYELSIVKTVTAVDGDTEAPFLVDEADDVISYSILVTNEGNTTLTNVTITDARISNLDCDGAAGNQTGPFTLAPGASKTCTGTYTVLQSDIDNDGGGDGDIDNTAKADSDQTEEVQDSESVPLEQDPDLEIRKTGTAIKNADGTDDSDGIADAAGDVLHYSILVENTGNTTLTGVVVTDTLLNDLDCDAAAGQQTSNLTIPVGGSITCTGTYTITQDDIDNNGGGDGDIDNTATADSNETGSEEDSETMPLDQDPAILVTKTATNVEPDGGSSGKFENVGDVITYSVLVENKGNTTLTVTVTDPVAPDIDCDPALGQQTTVTIAVGGSVTCSATHTVTQDDIDAGFVLNVACADDGEGGAAEDCDEVNTPGKNQPTIETTDAFVPQDTIVLAGLTGATTDGDLHVMLRLGGDSCETGDLVWEYTWLNAGNGTYNTAEETGTPTDQPPAISADTDTVVRWCSEYTGDANNAARPLSDRGEVALIDFDPELGAGFGAGVLAMLAWSLWSRRRREDENAA